MKTRSTALLRILALFFAFWFAAAHAQIPRKINYQGYLTTPSGAAVNGTVAMTLRLYDLETAGNLLFTETHPSVTVANGIFNVQIGSVTPLVWQFLSPYFISVQVGSDPEMTPRRPLTSAPYAIAAENIAPGGNLYLSNSASQSIGNVFKGNNRFMHNYGALNTFLGENSGNFTQSGLGSNTGIGAFTLESLTTGRENTAIGVDSAFQLANGSGNTAIGIAALASNESGNGNTAVGSYALNGATSSNNIALGTDAGIQIRAGGNNIMIGNDGVAADSNTIRLGNGTHVNTVLHGTVKTAAIEATAPISTTSTVTATGGLITTGTVTATGAISTGSTVSAVGGITSAQSVTVVTGTAPKTVILPSNIGVNLPASGTTNRPLVLQAQGLEWIGFRDSAGLDKWHFNNRNGGLNFARTAQEDGQLFLATNGSVGIGTDAPTRAKLEINGIVTTALGAAYRVNASGGLALAPSNYNLSVYANGAAAAAEFIAFSDQRIKRITGRSNAARDLVTLSAIEVTDYTHIDTPQRGDKSHKKVIAQQVETVFPQAVSKITDVVPDIYQRAAVKDGWIVLNTNLKKGDRVRLIGKATQGVHEVLEVAAGRFRTAFKADSDTIFVYGREVNDFRTVDYEAIAMLNVSATQELHRRVEQQAAEIAQLKRQLAQFGALDAKVAQLMQQLNPPVAINASNTKP